MSINLAGDVAPHDIDADMPTLPPGDPRQAYWDEWAIGQRFVPLHAKEREDAGEEMTLDGVTRMLLSTASNVLNGTLGPGMLVLPLGSDRRPWPTSHRCRKTLRRRSRGSARPTTSWEG